MQGPELYDVPPAELLSHLNEALSPLRSRILRRLGIARVGPVLDLGAGYGLVTEELARRSAGPVIALDRRMAPLRHVAPTSGVSRVLADGEALPFEDESFELVYCQLVLMWQRSLSLVVSEIARVLRPKGTVLAVEPDYGGLMEWPEELAMKAVWLSALERAGADPYVGRKLCAAFEDVGLVSRVDLLQAPSEPTVDRFELLEDLPLTEPERDHLRRARATDARIERSRKLVHLPMLFVSAAKAHQSGSGSA